MVSRGLWDYQEQPALQDPQERMETRGKLELQDRKAAKETKENQGLQVQSALRGLKGSQERRVWMVRLGLQDSRACTDRKETKGPEDLRAQGARGDCRECLVLLERKERAGTLVCWVLLVSLVLEELRGPLVDRVLLDVLECEVSPVESVRRGKMASLVILEQLVFLAAQGRRVSRGRKETLDPPELRAQQEPEEPLEKTERRATGAPLVFLETWALLESRV